MNMSLLFATHHPHQNKLLFAIQSTGECVRQFNILYNIQTAPSERARTSKCKRAKEEETNAVEKEY